LKQIWLILHPASIVLIGSLKSVISQIFNYLSLPPVARYFPFGLMATELTFPSCGLKVYLIWKLVFQTLSFPSHPTEAKYG
jgi:hypothetical protein